MLSSFDFKLYIPQIENYQATDTPRGRPTLFDITGVSNPNVFYIEYRSDIKMVAGQMFEEAEMTKTYEDFGATNPIPIVISELVALENGLTVGSEFELSNLLQNDFEFESSVEAWATENLILDEAVVFEVIGLFDLIDRRMDLTAQIDEDWNEWNSQWKTINAFYIPANAAMSLNNRAYDVFTEFIQNSDFGLDGLTDDMTQDVATIYILNDPLEIDDFKEIVNAMLPDYYRVGDLSGSFQNFQSSMETILWIADMILVVAIIAAILILCLIMILSLRERRYELGVLLALGEKKSKIMSQILVEVMLSAIAGITLAVFVGSILSTTLTRSMLHNHLEAAVEPPARITSFDGTRNLDTLGFVIEMSPDEMIEAFDVSLDIGSISILYGIGIVTVGSSTIVPLVYIINLNPKKILMEAKS